jgi:hypothetical protein
MGEPVKKDVTVYRIEYELLPKMEMWTAFIGAYSHEQALLYLRRRVGTHRVITSGLQCRLDALTDEIRSDLINASLGKPTVKKDKAKEGERIPVTPVEPEEPEAGESKRKAFNRK